MRRFSQCCSQMPHFLGCTTRGAMTPNLNSAKIFVQCTYPQVSSSYVYSFGSYRDDNKQTNTQHRRSRKHPTLFATLWHWVIIKRQCIRCCNMSIKSLQWRCTACTDVSQARKYNCKNKWVLSRFLKVESFDVVQVSDGRLFHTADLCTVKPRYLAPRYLAKLVSPTWTPRTVFPPCILPQ